MSVEADRPAHPAADRHGLGGLGTLLGPVAGAFALTLALEQMRVLGDWRLVIYGAVLVGLIMFMPDGVVRRLLPGRRDL